MTAWLYQINAEKELEYGEKYTSLNFYHEINTSNYLEWKTRTIIPEDEEPKVGDIVLYWFVKTGTDKPGIYGLGIILNCYEENDDTNYHNWINHLPAHQCLDFIKKPAINPKIEKIINEIRNKKQAFGTMFKIENKQMKMLLAQIFQFIDYRCDKS